jgi:hypothetical protein
VTAADVVTCDHCGKDWPENSDGIWWRKHDDDTYCTDYDACTRRQIKQQEASPDGFH